MNNALLELKNASYSYDEQPDALKNVSVCIHAGERIAVIGGNGAGKSTFFLCCNGVLVPQHGEIYYGNRQIRHRRKDLLFLRERVGIVFQDPNQQFVGATLESEISFGPMNLQLPLSEVEHRVNQSMATMNLSQLSERPPHYLSGGEKKRLSIADVLAMHPDLILLDEPTASLDIANIRILENVLATLYAQGKTLVVSTHDVDFACRWASRILVFGHGRIVADGTPEKVFSNKSLLAQVGLQPPAIYSFTDLLREKGLLKNVPYPKDLDQLRQLLNQF